MIVDFSVLDTTPGGSSFCSPPAGWEGDDASYVVWLRERYKADHGFQQHMAVAAWFAKTWQHLAQTKGPHACALRKAISKL